MQDIALITSLLAHRLFTSMHPQTWDVSGFASIELLCDLWCSLLTEVNNSLTQ